jgi:esterase/lipase superfamily enzyme
MELLVFGHEGARVLLFPTRGARFYDYENWRVIEAISDKIAAGHLQIFCVDSIDHETFYSQKFSPDVRMEKHLLYEKYIIDEVLPFTRSKNPQPYMISAGCSLGAYHCMNIAFKYPQFFGKVVGMSGRYNLTIPMGSFRDLFDGYIDPVIEENTPQIFLEKYASAEQIEMIRKMEIILIIGVEDAFLQDNRHFSSTLSEHNIRHELSIWDEEAHKPWYWRKMFRMFI